jgi:hypothetical protein
MATQPVELASIVGGKTDEDPTDAMHGWSPFLVVIRVVAGPGAKRSSVPGNARMNGVRLGAEAVEEWNAAASTDPDAAAEITGVVAGKRLDGVANECRPREGVASDGAHPVTSSRDGVEPGRSDGTRDGRDGRVPRLL